jgi:EAL domain-containing protein (putative c-di-GMP-specific phosphodiesterase class I)
MRAKYNMPGKTNNNKSKVSVSIYEQFYFNKSLNLPTLIKEYEKVEKMLDNLQHLACITINFEDLSKLEHLYGSHVYNDMLSRICNLLKELKENLLRKDDIFVLDLYDVDTFVLFLSEPRDKNTKLLYHINDIAERVRIKLEAQIFYMLYPYLNEGFRPTIGYALEIKNPMINNMRLITNLVSQSKKMGEFRKSKHHFSGRYELQKIIIEENMFTVFQPIVDLQTLKVIGYEALSRGPKDTEFTNPLYLFNMAAECGLAFELDRLCRRKALERASRLKTKKKIFVNTLSMTIHDPEFRGVYLKELLADLKIKPENVVFEISEKLAIDNYSIFRESLKDYTDLGIVHAGDDMGKGHSDLERIMELHPGYLKIDISFVRDIDKSYIKQEIVKAIVTLAQNIGSKVIVEGIETKEEYETLRGLKVQYGQGFLFARPSDKLSRIRKDF